MEKKKKVIEGWISMKSILDYDTNGEILIFIWKKKWDDKISPPRKVRIEVEGDQDALDKR